MKKYSQSNSASDNLESDFTSNTPKDSIKFSPPLISPDCLAAQVGGNYRLDHLLAAVLRQGPTRIELSPLPQYSIDTLSAQARQDIKDLSRVSGSKIISTHVPAQFVSNLSGLTEYGFSEASRANTLNEIKKHIEFQAEATNGGACVVHIGEFPRPLCEYSEFEYGSNEKENSRYYLIDKSSGKLLTVNSFDLLFAPVYNEDKTIKTRLDGTFEFHLPISFKEFYEHKSKDITGKIYNNPYDAARDFLRYNQQVQIDQAIAHASELESSLTDLYNKRKKIIEAKKYWSIKEKELSPHELLRFYQQFNNDSSNLISPTLLTPTEYLEKQLRLTDSAIEYHKNTAIQLKAQALNAKQSIEDLKTPQEFAIQKSIETITEAAMFAMEKTKQAKSKNKDFEPIFIAPENLLPNSGFGSHPEELIELIEKARENFANRLITEKVTNSMQEAEDLAKQHIGATLDTEHLGLWKQFFKPREGESYLQTEKRFNDWFLSSIEKLANSGVVKHVHVADTYGRGHSNLPAGEGNLPIKDAIQILKEKGGITYFLSEGHGDPENSWTGALKYLSGVNINEKPVPFNKLQEHYFKHRTTELLDIRYVPQLSTMHTYPWTSDIPFE